MKRTLYTITLFTILVFSNPVFAQKKEFGYYIAGQSEQLYILNEAGKPITNETFNYVGEFSDNVFEVQKEGKYGFIDIKGNVVVPFLFNWVSEMKNGTAIVELDEKYGLIDKKGKYLITPKYEYLKFESFNDGLAIFKQNGLEGAINKSGKIIIPNEYDYIGEFYNGYAVAKKNGKVGIIDKKGNTIVPFKYYYLGNVINRFSISFQEDEKTKMGLMDLKEKVLIKPEYDFVYPEKDGLVYLNAIKIDKKGLADKNGNILLPVDYQDVRRLSDGMILLEKDKKYGFANNKGEIIIPLVYDEAENFSEGLAPVLKDGKWGFINSKNETVIDFKFVGVMMPFYKGYAPYGKRNFSSGAHYTSDLWGLIDRNGNIVISNKYYNASSGYNGCFVVEIDGKKMLINEKEEVVALLKYEERPVQMQIGN